MGNFAHSFEGFVRVVSVVMKDKSLKSYVILRRSGWPSLDALHTSAKRSLEVSTLMGDVSWVRSYVLNEPDGRVGTVCHYRASSPEAIRLHAERVGIPVDDIVEVGELVVLQPDDVTELTSRERQVLGLVAEGMRNRDIAERLVVSVRTVDHHVAAILRKLRARTRVAAVAEARRQGLLAAR
jgi:DNA-binding CsgD family transcriptional regulator